jgi:hypothetical protein
MAIKETASGAHRLAILSDSCFQAQPNDAGATASTCRTGNARN